MNSDKLSSVAKAIIAKQKGVLAADENTPTIKKLFDTINVESTEENRRRYREILFSTPGIERYIGGVILFDETLRQGTQEGIPFADLLSSRGIIPGIKVDKGAKTLALCPDDKITEGLDGLRERLIEYKQMGPHPWQVGFSYRRALQAPVLAAWKGLEDNRAAAQKTFLKRCRLNGLARDGKYARAGKNKITGSRGCGFWFEDSPIASRQGISAD